MLDAIMKVAVAVCIAAGAGFLLFLATAMSFNFCSWLKYKHEELRMKTYRVEYYYFKYQQKIDKDECLVFPMKNLNFCYVKARNFAKALSKFYENNRLGFDHTLVNRIDEVKA